MEAGEHKGKALVPSTPSPRCQHSDLHANEFTGTAAEVADQRALANQWTLFANASLALLVPANRKRELPQLLEVLDGLLAGGRSLLAGPWGDPAWSVADCAVNAYLDYLPIFFPQIDLTPYPNVQAPIAATQARPSHQRGMGRA